MIFYYAVLRDNVVTELKIVSDSAIRVSPSKVDAGLGSMLLASLYGGLASQYILCSTEKDSRGGVDVGFTYDYTLSAFIPPQDYPSWVFDKETFQWMPPIARPTNGHYYWDEPTISWIEYEQTS